MSSRLLPATHKTFSDGSRAPYFILMTGDVCTCIYKPWKHIGAGGWYFLCWCIEIPPFRCNVLMLITLSYRMISVTVRVRSTSLMHSGSQHWDASHCQKLRLQCPQICVFYCFWNILYSPLVAPWELQGLLSVFSIMETAWHGSIWVALGHSSWFELLLKSPSNAWPKFFRNFLVVACNKCQVNSIP